MKLDAIGIRFGSDKSSEHHNYLSFYEENLSDFKDKEFTLIEFCDNSTASLMIWKEYFSRALIVGVFKNSSYLDFHEARIEIEIGDQQDEAFLISLADRYAPHVVIDDGTHNWNDQQSSFRNLFPIMPRGSLYFIEDLHTSYDENIYQNYGNDPNNSTYSKIKRLAEHAVGALSHEHVSDIYPHPDLIHSISFGKNICLIHRNQEIIKTYRDTDIKQCADKFFAVDRDYAYQRIGAEIIDAPPKLTDEWNAVYRNNPVYPPVPAAGIFQNALVYGRGMVIANDKQIVSQSLINTYSYAQIGNLVRIRRENNFLHRNDICITKRYDDQSYVLMKQTWDNNYGHWIIESLPRVEIVKQFFDLSELKFIVADQGEGMNRVYADSLRAYGINADQIVYTDDTDTLHVSRLIYPAPLTVQPWIKSPFAIRSLEAVRDRLTDLSPPPNNPIVYVSRNKINRRKLLNEHGVVDIVQQAGGVVVYPEELGFQEQVVLFGQARLVIGVLGAALANCAFSSDGITLIALTTKHMQDDFFWDILCHKRGKYISIHGNAVGSDADMQSDFEIDLHVFKRVFEQELKAFSAETDIDPV